MRYIDADKLMDEFDRCVKEYESDDFHIDLIADIVNDEPTADVRENITAHKVIGGGEHDGATCWFECSNCHETVDIDDAYCKHCGAQMER